MNFKIYQTVDSKDMYMKIGNAGNECVPTLVFDNYNTTNLTKNLIITNTVKFMPQTENDGTGKSTSKC